MEKDMKAIIGSMVTAGLLIAGSVQAEEIEMPPLAKKFNCNACHDIDRVVIGPSWRDIAMKYKGVAKYTYKGKEYPLSEGLVVKVSKGGSGNWGKMPMPGNDPAGTRQSDMTELVKFILSLPEKVKEKEKAK
jgi:cytochrome c